MRQIKEDATSARMSRATSAGDALRRTTASKSRALRRSYSPSFLR
jgi:hypothetical protein